MKSKKNLKRVIKMNTSIEKKEREKEKEKRLAKKVKMPNLKHLPIPTLQIAHLCLDPLMPLNQPTQARLSARSR